VREIMNEIFSHAATIIERYEGRIDKLLGDAVMAVFGDPTARFPLRRSAGSSSRTAP
jgi:class 3 adenylate cyclase